MENTVSRRSAIEAILKEANKDGTYGYIDAKTAVDVLNGLPEEEPEWTMDDLIVRGDAIDAMTDDNIIRNMDSVYDCALRRIKRSMTRILAGLPSAKPEHSAWVNAKDGYSGHVKCKVCFKTYDWDSEAQYFNFCPNCGKNVRGEKDGKIS